MALNFPNAPNVGDTYNGPNNIVWQWDGVAWNAVAGSISDAPQDGFYYERENTTWQKDPLQSDAPADGNYYTRRNNAWTVGGGATPIGTVVMFAVAAPPSGWLLCDGTVYNIATYPALGAILGTKYGGDGVSTFAVPNYVNSFLYGASAAASIGAKGGSSTIAVANLPALTFTLPAHGHGFSDPGHAHTVPAHTHGFNDPGHAHSIADPGHAHTTYIGGSYGYGIGATAPPSPLVNSGNNGYGSSGSGTGIGIYAAGTGCSVAANGPWGSSAVGTGCSVQNAGAINTNTLGSGAAYMPPYTGISYIIRAL